ncbi:MAG: hypothetical protein ABI670_04170 [Chloroflexota bacterium]
MLALLALLALTGCLEQYQSTRLPSGSLNNFLLHLQNGELDDALTYFAPGLVSETDALKASVRDASNKVKQYEIRKRSVNNHDLQDGLKLETLSGEIRPRTLPGQPTPEPEAGWQQTDIISATMAMRGPGWRLLDFKLLCCGD